MYKRINPSDLVVGKTYYIVPMARLISNNMANVPSIPESKKKRFLFPEGKLETMLGVSEGSSYRENARAGGHYMYNNGWHPWVSDFVFTGLNTHGKPLVNSVRNFTYQTTEYREYAFFSTELTE